MKHLLIEPTEFLKHHERIGAVEKGVSEIKDILCKLSNSLLNTSEEDIAEILSVYIGAERSILFVDNTESPEESIILALLFQDLPKIRSYLFMVINLRYVCNLVKFYFGGFQAHFLELHKPFNGHRSKMLDWGVLRSSSSCPTRDALWPHHHFDSLTYKPLGWANL